MADAAVSSRASQGRVDPSTWLSRRAAVPVGSVSPGCTAPSSFISNGADSGPGSKLIGASSALPDARTSAIWHIRVAGARGGRAGWERPVRSGPMEFNLADLWEAVVDGVPDKEALVWGGPRL